MEAAGSSDRLVLFLNASSYCNRTQSTAFDIFAATKTSNIIQEFRSQQRQQTALSSPRSDRLWDPAIECVTPVPLEQGDPHFSFLCPRAKETFMALKMAVFIRLYTPLRGNHKSSWRCFLILRARFHCL